MSLSLRAAELADLETIVGFNQALALETEGLSLDLERLRAGVRAGLQDPQRSRYFLAEQQGQPVGQVMFTDEWSDWRNGWFWWIQSVYVRPEARRQGVYSALHTHVHRLAREHPSVCGVRLYVHHQNQSAQKTYRALEMQQAHYTMFEVDFALDRDA